MHLLLLDWHAETSLWFPFKLCFSGCWKSWFEYWLNCPKSWVCSWYWQEKSSHGSSSCAEGKWCPWKGNTGENVLSSFLCFYQNFFWCSSHGFDFFFLSFFFFFFLIEWLICISNIRLFFLLKILGLWHLTLTIAFDDIVIAAISDFSLCGD